MTPLRRRLAALVLALLPALLPAAAAHAQIPPDAAWRTFSTPHFHVHFTAGLDSLARRAGARAEAAHAELSRALVRPPTGRIDLLVTDNVDFANGFATVFPRERVVIFAHPPVDDPSLPFYDDWLDLVITHELAHVFHLDYAAGVPRALRRVFGRSLLTFPNVTVPSWQVEGLATYLESRLTRAGRVRATLHDMALRTAVLQDSFFSIGQASGDPRSWPAGNTSYVYGSLFLTWMAERHGEEAAGEFVRTYGARVVPFLVDRAAKRAYGESYTRAWDEWWRELENRYRAQAAALRAQGLTEPQVLTTAGRNTRFPRWSPDGRWIAHAASTGFDEPSTRVVSADGREVRVLASRTTIGSLAWEPGGRSLLTTMIDVSGQYRYYSDLHRVGAEGGRDRVTRDARILHVDVAPAGPVVTVRSAPGTTELRIAPAAGQPERTLAPGSLGEQWAYARLSPDGRRVAASRWRTGGRYDVVVLDAASGAVLAQATDDRAVDMTPAWSPDGRYVLFSSDRTGIANLYAYDTQGGRLQQVTNVLTGAFDPDVSPDGRWIAFAYYQADGYHVARIPFDPAAWRPAPPVRPEVGEGEATPPGLPVVSEPDRRYSAWRTLAPAWWEPTVLRRDVLGTAIGAATTGEDIIERHSYGASAQVYTREGRVEAGAGYLYRGLGNPTLGVSAFQDWDVLADANQLVGPDDVPIPTAFLERERSASAVATFARPRFRSYTWLSLGANLRDRERVFDDPEAAAGVDILDPPPEVGAVATLGVSTSRAHDFSVSAENGFVAAVSAEARRFTREIEGEEGTRGYSRFTGRAQGYRGFRAWGYARHVLALRLGGGVDAGSRSPGYSVGGTGGLPVAFPLSTATGLGGDVDLPVRGYPEGSQVGDRGASATAEWRFPLVRVERAPGLVPLFLDRLWGTAFADAGTAWCVETCDPVFRPFTEARPLVSAGAELGADVTIGFNLRMRLRGGIAFPLRDVEDANGVRSRPGVKTYFTFGQSF